MSECVYCGETFEQRKRLKNEKGRIYNRLTCSDKCTREYRTVKRRGDMTITSTQTKDRYNQLCEIARKDERTPEVVDARTALRKDFMCTGLYNKDKGRMMEW